MAFVLPSVVVATRPRGFVRVSGPQAADYLQRMVSNDVEALAVGASCDAMLLTPKARLIAVLRIVRRGQEDFLLLTEPELAETVRAQLVQYRFAARAEIEIEEHGSCVVLGDGIEPPDGVLAVPNDDYGVPGWEILDGPEPEGERLPDEELERLRIEAGTPAWRRELDDRILPAEAGLVERAVSLTKGCYPGQEPIARLHYRGHANRGLRRLRIESATPPEYDAELLLDGKTVGRVTSAIAADGAVLALGYVRAEVPEGAELSVGDAVARPLH
jgi:tRNA-modifying protein YgfZ